MSIPQGLRAETAACAHLTQNGLVLLARNYRCRRGEIDLIMRDGDTIVFTEVRFRRQSGFGSPLETVDARKQARLILAARHWLQRHDPAGRHPARFDVVAIEPGPHRPRIQWIRSAFDAF